MIRARAGRCRMVTRTAGEIPQHPPSFLRERGRSRACADGPVQHERWVIAHPGVVPARAPMEPQPGSPRFATGQASQSCPRVRGMGLLPVRIFAKLAFRRARVRGWAVRRVCWPSIDGARASMPARARMGRSTASHLCPPSAQRPAPSCPRMRGWAEGPARRLPDARASWPARARMDRTEATQSCSFSSPAAHARARPATINALALKPRGTSEQRRLLHGGRADRRAGAILLIDYYVRGWTEAHDHRAAPLGPPVASDSRASRKRRVGLNVTGASYDRGDDRSTCHDESQARKPQVGECQPTPG